EVADERMIAAVADFSGHFDTDRTDIYAIEFPGAVRRLVEFDAVKSCEKVQMPPASAEFPVCDTAEAVRFLGFNEPADLFVFDTRQLIKGDLSLLELSAGFL